MASEQDMSSWTDLLHSSSKLLEQAAPSAQFPPLQVLSSLSPSSPVKKKNVAEKIIQILNFLKIEKNVGRTKIIRILLWRLNGKMLIALAFCYVWMPRKRRKSNEIRKIFKCRKSSMVHIYIYIFVKWKFCDIFLSLIHFQAASILIYLHFIVLLSLAEKKVSKEKKSWVHVRKCREGKAKDKFGAKGIEATVVRLKQWVLKSLFRGLDGLRKVIWGKKLQAGIW